MRSASTATPCASSRNCTSKAYADEPVSRVRPLMRAAAPADLRPTGPAAAPAVRSRPRPARRAARPGHGRRRRPRRPAPAPAAARASWPALRPRRSRPRRRPLRGRRSRRRSAARPAARATDKIVPSTGAATASYAASAADRRPMARSRPRAAARPQRAGEPGQQLRHDHARVAARAEQRAAGEAGHRGGEIRRRLARQVILRGRERQHQIRAGVAVRDRIDVQLVDLVLVLGAVRRDRPRTSGVRRRHPDCPARIRSVIAGRDKARAACSFASSRASPAPPAIRHSGARQSASGVQFRQLARVACPARDTTPGRDRSDRRWTIRRSLRATVISSSGEWIMRARRGSGRVAAGSRRTGPIGRIRWPVG